MHPSASRNAMERLRPVRVVALAAAPSMPATWVGAEPHGEVFRNPGTGERWSGSQAVQRIWVTALKRASVRYRRPYQTRHTYASMMLSAGEQPMWVAKQMGHKDWAMIIRVYGKWMPSADPDAGGKAADLFGEKLASSCHSGAQTAPKHPKKNDNMKS